MDINTLRGISTLLMLVAFIGVVIWAYSGRRKQSFDEAAQLPFADDDTHQATLQREATAHRTDSGATASDLRSSRETMNRSEG